MSQYVLLEIKEAIVRMNNDQMKDIARIICDYDPELLNHKSQDGTSVLLNKFPKKLIQQLLNYIRT